MWCCKRCNVRKHVPSTRLGTGNRPPSRLTVRQITGSTVRELAKCEENYGVNPSSGLEDPARQGHSLRELAVLTDNGFK